MDRINISIHPVIVLWVGKIKIKEVTLSVTKPFTFRWINISLSSYIGWSFQQMWSTWEGGGNLNPTRLCHIKRDVVVGKDQSAHANITRQRTAVKVLRPPIRRASSTSSESYSHVQRFVVWLLLFLADCHSSSALKKKITTTLPRIRRNGEKLLRRRRRAARLLRRRISVSVF